MNKINTNNDDEVLEGEVLDSSYVYTTQDNDKNVKSTRKNKLSYKASKFAKNYIEGNTMGNGTRSAIKAGYAEDSASVTASRLLKDNRVLAILNDSVEDAQGVITNLMHDAESDAIRLAAAKEVLDRTQGKSIARTESTQVNISVEMMLNNTDD